MIKPDCVSWEVHIRDRDIEDAQNSRHPQREAMEGSWGTMGTTVEWSRVPAHRAQLVMEKYYYGDPWGPRALNDDSARYGRPTAEIISYSCSRSCLAGITTQTPLMMPLNSALLPPVVLSIHSLELVCPRSGLVQGGPRVLCVGIRASR